MKTIITTIVLCAMFSFMGHAQQRGVPVRASGIPSSSPMVVPANLVTCDGVLPNYTNSLPDPAGGVTSQDFETANDAYDNMAADDFVAPGTGQSILCEVDISGTNIGAGLGADPGSQVILRIFQDNSGIPGTLLYDETFPGTVDGDSDGSFVLEPTGSLVFDGGVTYWISVQAKLDYTLAGQWFWNTATDVHGEPYYWQNPDDGFGYGCTNWTEHSLCGLPGVADLMMDISFNEVLGVASNTMENAIEIFPNPVTSAFTLRSAIALNNLTVFDISGRIVRNVDLSNMSNEKTIDVSSLSSGIYMVQISGTKGTIVRRLSKE